MIAITSQTKFSFTDNSLESLRAQIDAIDVQIVELLATRTRCSREIGEAKRVQGISVLDASREARVLEHVTRAASQVGLDSDRVCEIFEIIMRQSRKDQEARR